MTPIKRIGILTGGGDAPGLNAVIRAVVKTAWTSGIGCLGLEDSYDGLLEFDRSRILAPRDVTGILRLGGTILGTINTGNPFDSPVVTSEGPRVYSQRVVEMFQRLALDALVVIGGDGTLAIAHRFCALGIPIVGVPKTIDNDIVGTTNCFGFDTAVAFATDAIDRLHTTAEAHHRIMVVEVMGRHAGWIGLYAGIAGGADVILLPERPIDLDEVSAILRKRQQRGKEFSIVVVAEGATFKDASIVTNAGKLDAFGHVRLGGIGQLLGEQIEERTGFETRVTVLGHIQRGGSPTAYDRVLGTRYGIKAMELVEEGQFGYMAALRCNQMIAIPIEEAVKQLKTVDPELYKIATVFFG